MGQNVWTASGTDKIYYNPVLGVEKVGIANSNPQFPLDFGPLIQNRILSLYTSGTDFYGLGISAGKLRFEVPGSGNFGFFCGSSELFRVSNQGALVGAGISKWNAGSAYGSGLNWGTSYIGFNAARSGTSWTLDTDGGNNGGSAIWGTVGGVLYFATIPNSGTGVQTRTDAQVLASARMVILNDGKVAIGSSVDTSPSDYLLFVKKGIATGKVFVSTTWADYVFAPGYALPSLEEVRGHIQAKGHLPGIPSAAEVEAAGGVELSDMTLRQMEKIEELYLYVLQLQDRITELEARLANPASETNQDHE